MFLSFSALVVALLSHGKSSEAADPGLKAIADVAINTDNSRLLGEAGVVKGKPSVRLDFIFLIHCNFSNPLGILSI